ncbi:MAG: polysaccharide pyruvyl transferase family protein [Bacteroidia bacterium]|nr:polysaccharide pyruvyl transferase family protein [Bacteroidia bacterium]
MAIIYNTFLRFYYFAILFASIFNKKAKLFIAGRKNLFDKIKSRVNSTEKTAWFHAASLGEFEQGRPVIEAFKKKYPDFKILVTFFSPSGYEIRKNYQGADHIFYLPFDFPCNARKFIDIINPRIVFFIKYEYWYNYLCLLHRKKTPIFIFSSNFREGQVFFKWYGHFFRNVLKLFNHIFVQNERSQKLLYSIGINNVTISGDTRFDRVYEIAKQAKQIPLIEKFKQNNFTVIAGSTWEKDEELLVKYINPLPGSKTIKFIIAPHEIKPANIDRIYSSVKKKVLKFSGADETRVENCDVMIIDNIGMLSSLYKYGDIAYIGGGFGRGIHNTLEAATFSNPVMFGPNYHKFQEAKDLVENNAAFVIEEYDALKSTIDSFYDDPALLKKSSDAAREYVEKNRGGTSIIMKHVEGVMK